VVTPEFHIRVNEVADFDTAAESTSEFGVLDRLIGDVEAAVIECNAATDAMTEMTEDFENATATATTLAEGEAATVSLTDGALGKEFAFGIPKGDKGEKGDTGDAATITVGTVATVDPTAPATVVNSGTLAAAIFDFGIPKGVKGDMGEVSTAEMNAAITAATSITLTNLVSNSDFSDGTMGWSANLSTLSASDNTLFVTGNGTQRLSNLYGNIPATIPSGHRFCQRAYIKVDSALCTEIRIYGGDSSRVVETNPTIDIWHPITYIGTTGGDLDYAYFYHYYETPEICAGKVMSVRYVSMFDLTDLETALGREVTVGEMSAIMDIYDGWFSGSVNLSWLQLIMTIINLFHP